MRPPPQGRVAACPFPSAPGGPARAHDHSYVRTAVIDLLLRAAEDPARPYLVILDEMNLARVEYYFSDFLSALESGEPIELMAPGVEEELLALGHDEIPAQLRIPPNVSFVGTVNVDETTQSFSPKVLDRANVIEFSDVDVERALGHPVDDPSEGLRLKEGQLNAAWLCTTREQALAAGATAQANESFTEALEDVHDLLTRFHLQFGYRVIAEVSAFVGHAMQKVAGETELTVRRAFDLQLQQKVIPKLTGGRELERPLAYLLHYCHMAAKSTALDSEAVRNAARKALDPTDTSGVEPPWYPGSARKLLRMLDRLADTGFVGALE
jgi:5-methylcytosine-specific restriction protein B